MGSFFVLYLVVVFFEYFGIGRYAPSVNSLSLSLLISVGLLGYVCVKGEVREWLKERQAVLLLCLVTMSLISMTYAIVRLYSFNVVRAQVGYFIFLLITVYFVSDARRIRVLAWLLVLIHVVLIAENSSRLFSARIGSYDAAYFMGDGNDFAWGLNITFPLALYLFMTAKRTLGRVVLISAMAISIVGTIGTGSRGAAIALGAAFIYFSLTRKRKALGIMMLSLVAFGVLTIAPASYLHRLQTVGTYTEDTSSMDRIQAWRAATNMAIDYPLGVGAGNFNAAYGRYYRSEEASNPRWISAHSIYFLVLGEYGVLGVVLLVSIIVLNLRQNMRSAAKLKAAIDHPIPSLWPICINMSLVAFSVGGIFLGGVNYPHLYLLTALTIGAKVAAERIEAVTQES